MSGIDRYTSQGSVSWTNGSSAGFVSLFFTCVGVVLWSDNDNIHYSLQVGSVIKNPEIAALVPTLLLGLTDPNEHTKHSLDILLQV